MHSLLVAGPKIYDEKSDSWVTLTPTVAYEARKDPGKWPGCIERGPRVARLVLQNRVRLLMLTHSIADICGIESFVEMSYLCRWPARQFQV